MSAGTLHFNGIQADPIEQGITWEQHIQLEDGNRSIIEMFDYSAKLQVRNTYDVVIVELSIENGRISIDSNGCLLLLLTPEETALLPTGRFVYDLFIIEPTTEKTDRILEGEFVIKKRITR